MRALSGHAGIVHCPLDRVRTAVLTVRPGTFSGSELPAILGATEGSVVIDGGPERFTANVRGVSMVIEVDEAAGWVQATGQRWWCRRFEVREDPAGARVEQRTYNLASGIVGRLVPFTVGHGHRRRGRASLQRLLDDLGRRLSCDTEMVD